MAFRPLATLVAIALAALLAAPLADAQAGATYVNSTSGDFQLEVTPNSSLSRMDVNRAGGPWGMAWPPSPGSGWGACYGANVCVCPSGSSTCPNTAPPSAATATVSGSVYTTTHTVGNLRIEHRWAPYAQSLGVSGVRADVTLTNLAPGPLENIHYRRGEAFVWGPVPGTFATMTMGSNQPTVVTQYIVASSDTGMANPMPGASLGSPPYGNNGTCPYYNGPGYQSGGSFFNDRPESSHSPCQPGGMVEIFLGNLTGAGTRSFAMFYGVESNQTAALDRLGPAQIGADFWFLAQSSNLNQAATGTPYTVYWGFNGRGWQGGPCNSAYCPAPAGSSGNTTCNPNNCPCPTSPCGGGGGGGNGTCTPNTCPCPTTPCGGSGSGNGTCTPNTCPCPTSPCGGGNGGGSGGSGSNSTCSANCTQAAPGQSYPSQSSQTYSSGGSSYAPASGYSYSPATPAPGQPVTFTDASSDADGALVDWFWDFGDGTQASGSQATHRYSQPGTYTVTLQVRDDSGATSMATSRIVVQAPTPAAAAGQGPNLAGAQGLSGSSLSSGLGSSVDDCIPATLGGKATCGTATHEARSVPTNPLQPQATSRATQGAEALVILLALVGVGGLAMAAVAGRRRWLAFALPLFSRLDRSDVLEHPVRSQLMELLEAEPGLHVMELSRRTGRSRSDVQHHLRVLERATLVKGLAAAGMVRYFPGPGKPDMSTLAQGPASRRVLEAAASSPGLTLAELAERSGMAYGAAHYHVRRLEKAGLVELQDAGQMRVFARAKDSADPAPTTP